MSRGITLIGFGVRLVSFLLEAFPGLPGCWWPPDSPVTLLAQTLISSGVLFIMINAEMINENANDGEVPQHQRGISLIPSHWRIDQCHPRACLQRGTWPVARTPAARTWWGFPPHMPLFIFC